MNHSKSLSRVPQTNPISSVPVHMQVLLNHLLTIYGKHQYSEGKTAFALTITYNEKYVSVTYSRLLYFP